MQNPIFDIDTQDPDSNSLTQINPKLNNSKSKLIRGKKSRQVKNRTEKNLEFDLENKETQNPIFDMDTQVPDSDALTQINPKLNNSKSKLIRGKKSRQVKNRTEKNLEFDLENKETQNPIFDMDTQVPDSDALTQINPKLNNSKSKLTRGKKSRQVKNRTEKNLEFDLENKETQNPIFDMDTQVPDSDALTQINPKLNNSKSKLIRGKKSRQVKNRTEKNLEFDLENKETQNPIFDMDTQVPDSDALTQINPKLNNSKSKLIRGKKSRQVKNRTEKNLEFDLENKETQNPIFEMDTQVPDADVLTQVNMKISDQSRTSINKCEVQLKSNETIKSVHDIQHPYASTRLEDVLTQINYNLQEKHQNRNVQNNQVEYQKSKTQVSSSLSFSKSIPISPKDKQIFKSLTQINRRLQEENEVNRGDQNDDDSSIDIDENSIFSSKTHVSNSAPVSKMLPVNTNKEAEETDVFEATTQINFNLEDKNVVGANKDDQNIDDNSTDIDEDSVFNVIKFFSSTPVSKISPISKIKEAEDTDVYKATTRINLEDKNVCGINRDDQNIDDNSTDIDEDSIFNATTFCSSTPGSKISPLNKNKEAEDTDVYKATTRINLEDKNVCGINRDDQNIDDNSTDIDEDSIFNATTFCSSTPGSKISPLNKNKEAEDTDVYKATTRINLEDKNVCGINRDDQNIDDNSTDIDEDSIFNATTFCSSTPGSKISPLNKNKEAEDTDVYKATTRINLEDKNVCGINRHDQNIDDNSTDIDEDLIFNNNEISKTEVSVSDKLSNDEMISQYSDNSFNLPPDDVLLEAIAIYEANLSPGNKPVYSDEEDEEDEEEIINSPQELRRSSRIRKTTNTMLNHIDSCTTIKKVTKKKNLKKTNDSMCIEKAQKEAVKMKKPVGKFKKISVGKIELFTGESKLKGNNSKEILGDTSSLKSENAVKKYSAEEEKLMEIGRKVCESQKRVDNITETLGKDGKVKRVFKKTKGENNLTDDIPVKKSKQIATQKQLSTIITVDLEESNDESDLVPLIKIKKRGKNLKNLTSKSKRAKYESCIQPETGVTIVAPNSSVVYDSPSSCVNTKTDSLIVECTTSYKSENLPSKRDKVNKIVKKNTTAQRQRNIDEFFLPVASMSRRKDSVSCDNEGKTTSFSNNSGSSIHSTGISSPELLKHVEERSSMKSPSYGQ